jgi:hypothetical protein
MFSSEHNFTVGTEQYDWLAAELASVDRTQTPWLMLSCHRPFYTSDAALLRGVLRQVLVCARRWLGHVTICSTD